MLKTLLEGLMLGLSLGTTCLATCLPIYLPYIVSEDNSLKKSFLKVMEISAGRFVPYLLFGALAGWLGSFVPTEQRVLYTGISYILLSVFLILNSIRTHRESKSCAVAGVMKVTKSPFLLGVVTGISFCPTFLIALTKSVDLGGVLSGTILFLGFFFGTTVYLIPLALGGLLTVIGKVKLAARYISILIAVWFLWQGGVNIHQAYQEKQKRVINPMEATLLPVIIMPAADSLYSMALSDSLAKIYTSPAKVLLSDKLVLPELSGYSTNAVLYIAGSLWQDSFEKGLEKQNYVIVPHDYPIGEITHFLAQYSFKVNKKKGFHWNFDIKEHPKK